MQLPRSSGVLLHPTSLPGGHGVGDLGSAARQFVDRLAQAQQSWWQLLPLNPPDYLGSPYSSASSMACNPVLIDLRELADRGWLDEDDLSSLPSSPDPSRFETRTVTTAKLAALRKAFERSNAGSDPEFAEFCAREAAWLDDYALFDALKGALGGADWRSWPGQYVRRDKDALAEARREHEFAVAFSKFCQWVFDRQWHALRQYAASRGIKIIGDVPIFVAMDSVDVWANRDIFEVDDAGRSTVVAGVPPDYFSPTGQKWGNPLFRWDVLADREYAWWKQRIARISELVDIVRIDHFRGFESYWAVPAEAPTAETGEWRKGPADDFFEAIRAEFGDVPVIAEDLGMITDAVHELRDRQGLPGMKIMQFAFDGEPDHPFLPHTYPENCVAYTGTHDNDTTLGWWKSTSDHVRHNARTYLSSSNEEIVWSMISALHDSDANLVVVPVQDLYELGTEARMNFPGTSEGNWTWRMTPEQLDDERPWKRLGQLTDLYGR